MQIPSLIELSQINDLIFFFFLSTQDAWIKDK